LTLAIAVVLTAPDLKAADDPAANRAAAHKLFDQSELRYREGKFQEAAVLLREAYALDPAPILLFNLARALESAGDLSGAVDAYERYLEADPNAKDRGAVEKRVENLHAQIKEKEDLKRARDQEARRLAELEEQAKLSEARREKGSSIDPLPWITVGAGAAGLIAGGVIGYLALQRHNEAVDEPIQVRASDLDQQSHSLQTGANIAYVAGGAIAAGGLVWALLSLRSDEGAHPAAPTAWISPAISPRAASIAISW
jgi:tetratricopeptide (TPR) repeat protein